MRNLIIAGTIVAVGIVLVEYLLFCFIGGSFNPLVWDSWIKALFALVALPSMFSVAVSAMAVKAKRDREASINQFINRFRKG